MSSWSTIELVAAIFALTAAIAWLNARLLRLPTSIAMMSVPLVLAIAAIGLDAAGAIDASPWQRAVAQVDLSRTLLDGLLGPLLFAGALHIDLGELRTERATVAVLAIGATIASMALVAGGLALALVPLGSPLSARAILLFAALISPTDPVAVLAALKSSRMPRTIATQLRAESLFNDGIAVVLFVVVGGAAADSAGGATSALHVVGMFLREVAGGAALGLALGWLGRRGLAELRDAPAEVLVTLALVLGGYALGAALGISAPIAAAVAGIAIGNDRGVRARIAPFWHIVDELLDAVVFVLLGLEAIRISLTWNLLAVTAVGIAVVLAARLASVAGAFAALRPLGHRPPPHAVRLLTWGGLRGALSVAMALAIADDTARSQIVAMTYGLVAFSTFVQGATLPGLLRRLGTSA